MPGLSHALMPAQEFKRWSFGRLLLLPVIQKANSPKPARIWCLKLVIKEEALPLKEQPEFPALAELAKRGLLARGGRASLKYRRPAERQRARAKKETRENLAALEMLRLK